MATASQAYRASIGAWVKARLLRNPNALKVDCAGFDLFVVRDFLSPDQCAALIDLIDQHLTPSEIMTPHPDPDYRTSYSGNPPPSDPLIVMLNDRFHEVIGIQHGLGESPQGQRYEVGQQFKPHWDYFTPGEPYFEETERTGGQRTWTGMVFLNEPEVGGYTNFTEVGVSIRPRTGNLLVWNNLTPEGDPNPLSMHQGTPVTAGVKYIITKWYRERSWVPEPDDPKR